MIVDSIIKSLVEEHPDLLNSFEGGNWDDFLNGVYPDDVEIIVLRNIVEYAHFNEYLPEDVVLLKKENFYTIGGKFLDGEQGYEVPLLEGEEKVVDKEATIPQRSNSTKNKNKKKKRNKLYYLLYFLIFLSVVILGIFLVLNGSTAQEAPQKDISQLPRKTEKKVENQNKGSESKKEEIEKKAETSTSEAKKEEAESNPQPANSQSGNSSNSSNRRNSSSSNQEVGSTPTPAQPSNITSAQSSEKPVEAPTKEEATTEKPSVEEKSSEEPKETPKEEKKDEAKDEPTSPSDKNKTEDEKNSTSEKDKKIELLIGSSILLVEELIM